jgi:hypothetical protein
MIGLALALSAAVGAVAWSQATASDEPEIHGARPPISHPRIGPQAQWEYKQIWYPVYFARERGRSPDTPMDNELRRLGEEGWELVSVTVVPSDRPTPDLLATFKRQSVH